jgi:putative acyl-CoA dehydrogenase
LMQNVLADLSLESEAATLLMLRLARAVDEAPANSHAAALKRIGTAVGKYYVCKRAPMATAEALECLGGNGYVEESIMPRLYREAPLNSIWEGSGNINALDVLRIIAKQPEAVEALRIEVTPALEDRRVAEALRSLEAGLKDRESIEWRARSLVERMALLWQASLLVQHAPNYVSDGFIASRLSGESGHTLGTLPIKTALKGIVTRAAPSIHETASV